MRTSGLASPQNIILVPVSGKSRRERWSRRHPKVFRIFAVLTVFLGLLLSGGVGSTASQPAQAEECFIFCVPTSLDEVGEVVSDIKDNVTGTIGQVTQNIASVVPGGQAVLDNFSNALDNVTPDDLSVITDPVGAVQDSVADALCFYQPPPTLEDTPSLQPWPGSAQVASNVATAGTMYAADYIASMLNPVGPVDDRLLYAGKDVTAYEWYGTAGLTWESNNYKDTGGACSALAAPRLIMGSITSFMWSIVTVIGSIGLQIFYLASIPDALGAFLGAGGPIDGFLKKAYNSVFLVFLAPMVMFVALWVAWQGLVRKRTTESIQGVAWATGSAFLITLFLVQPTTVVAAVNNVLSEVQSLTLNALAGAGSRVQQTGWCSLPNPASAGMTSQQEEALAAEQRSALQQALTGAINPVTGKKLTAVQQQQMLQEGMAMYEYQKGRWRYIREAQCTIWEAFLFTPWAAGQFGEVAGWPLKDYTGTSGDAIDNYKIVVGNKTLDFVDPSSGAPIKGTPVAMVQLDSTTLNHDQVWKLQNGTPDQVAEVQAAIEGKAAAQVGIYDFMRTIYMSAQNTEVVAGLTEGERVSLAQGVNGVRVWTGENWTVRVSTVILALLAMATAAIPIFLMAFSILVYQLGTVVLLFVAPIFLVFGIHPGFGRKMTLGWLEQFLNITLKRLGVTVVLAIMLAMMQLIVTMSAPLLVQMLMLAGVGIAVLKFRKRIVNTFAAVKFNTGDQIWSMEKSAEKAKERSKKISAAAVGGATGFSIAKSGGASNKAAASAAALGGMSGMATGSASAAAMSGAGIGFGQARASSEKQSQESRSERNSELIQMQNMLRNNGVSEGELRDLRDVAEKLGMDEARAHGARLLDAARGRNGQDPNTVPVQPVSPDDGVPEPESASDAEQRHAESQSTLNDMLERLQERGLNDFQIKRIMDVFDGDDRFAAAGVLQLQRIRMSRMGNDAEALHRFDLQNDPNYLNEYITYVNVRNEDASSANVQVAMEASGEQQAQQWIQYSRDGGGRPVPTPKDNVLKEILEEAGVGFLPTHV